MRNVADEYLETTVETASPERLHLMVVDAAIRFARQAHSALEQEDIAAGHLAVNRSRACVTEMLTGIVEDPNPDLARRLKSLFLFVHRNLVQADLLHDPKRVRDALQILEIHRETWLELLDRVRIEQNELRGPHAATTPVTSWTT